MGRYRKLKPGQDHVRTGDQAYTLVEPNCAHLLVGGYKRVGKMLKGWMVLGKESEGPYKENMVPVRRAV